MAANNDSSANMITVIVRSPKESKDIVINGRETVKQVKRTCVVIYRPSRCRRYDETPHRPHQTVFHPNM